MQCPCGSGASLKHCCGPCLEGAAAVTAEQLMRSRYTAFVLQDEAYLLATWHPTTRPLALGLYQDHPCPRWLGLKIMNFQIQDETHATVEFVARQKVAGHAYRMHELSRFLFVDGRWFYVDGKIP